MPPTTDSINVLVTGFGPFPKFDGHGGIFDRNASHLVTRLLPPSLAPSHPLNPTAHSIKILNPTVADGAHVNTEYAFARTYTSRLHAQHRADVTLFLHLGMAPSWAFVSVERRAYKQGFSSSWWRERERKAYYMLEDVTGKTVADIADCPWGADVPVGLCPALDIDAVAQRAAASLRQKEKKQSPRVDSAAPATPAVGEAEAESGNENGNEKGKGAEGSLFLPVRPHDEAGSYLCGFLYYESLANKYVHGTRGEVLFCHVPGATDAESLAQARDSVLAVIGAAVEQILETKSQ